jgi:DNA polymerase alpha subunit A
VKEFDSLAAYRKPVTVEKEDDFMSNLLSTMDASKSSISRSQMHQQRPAPRKRKSSPALETSSDGESHNLGPPSLVRKGSSNTHRPAPLDRSEQYTNHDTPSRAQKRPKFDPELEGKVSELKVEDGIEDTAMDGYAEFDLDMEVDFDVKSVITSDPSGSAIPKKAETQSWVMLHSSLLAAPVQPEEALDPSGTSASGNVDVLEKDGSLQLYWLDFTETNGKLYLIGKVLDKTARKYVSCCLGIAGLERNLFVVPRDRVFGVFPRCLQYFPAPGF